MRCAKEYESGWEHTKAFKSSTFIAPMECMYIPAVGDTAGLMVMRDSMVSGLYVMFCLPRYRHDYTIDVFHFFILRKHMARAFYLCK